MPQPGGQTLEAVDVTQDHKPKDPSEERRIKACGGRVDRLVASECPGLREVHRGDHQCLQRLYRLAQAGERPELRAMRDLQGLEACGKFMDHVVASECQGSGKPVD